jgi:hypothetical protein
VKTHEVFAALALLALAGCGDDAKRARWTAERARWHSHRMVERATRSTPPNARWLARAEQGLVKLEREFPIDGWAGRPAPGRLEREAAQLLGFAEVDRANVERLTNRSAEAIRRLKRVDRLARTQYREVADAALRAEGDLLEQTERPLEALRVWSELSARPALDDSGRVLRGALSAPLRAFAVDPDARARWERLARAEAAWLDELARARAGADRAEIRWVLAGARRLSGDSAGVFEALRGLLSEPLSPEARSPLPLELARAAHAAGFADSARRYARWAAGEGPAESRREGALLLGRLWEESGPRDSALAAYARLLANHPKAQDFVAEARMRRAMLLERDGLWEVARPEYRALIAALPTHRRSFDAVLRIVEHHRRSGEDDLARLEARRAIDQMNLLIQTQHDDTIQRLARGTRDSLLAAAGSGRREAP